MFIFGSTYTVATYRRIDFKDDLHCAAWPNHTVVGW